MNNSVVETWTLLRTVVAGTSLPQYVHQLNNHLTSAMCHLQLMLDDPRPEFLEQSQTSLQACAASSETLIQYWSEPLHEKSEILPREFLQGIAALAALLPVFAKANIQIDTASEGELPRYEKGILATLMLALLAQCQSHHPPRCSILGLASKRSAGNDYEFHICGPFRCSFNNVDEPAFSSLSDLTGMALKTRPDLTVNIESDAETSDVCICLKPQI